MSELDGSVLSIKSGDGDRRFYQDDVVVIRQRMQDPLAMG